MTATAMSDAEIRNRFNVLTWAIGGVGALVIATLGMVVTMSSQLGQISGELAVMINHVTLK
jgi:hypothetical protein